VVSFTPRKLYPRYPLDRRLGGAQSRSERGGEEKNFEPCRESNPVRPARSLVTTPTETTVTDKWGIQAVRPVENLPHKHNTHEHFAQVTSCSVTEIAGRLGLSYGTCQRILRTWTCGRSAAHSSLSVQRFLATKNMAVVPHPPYSPDLVPCDFFLVSENGIEAKRASFPGYHWNSGTTADRPTRDSKKSVPAVLPAVTETLDPLHELGRGILWRRQQQVITKVNIYFVITQSGNFWIHPRILETAKVLYTWMKTAPFESVLNVQFLNS
jgi:hypothetical protein